MLCSRMKGKTRENECKLQHKGMATPLPSGKEKTGQNGKGDISYSLQLLLKIFQLFGGMVKTALLSLVPEEN